MTDLAGLAAMLGNGAGFGINAQAQAQMRLQQQQAALWAQQNAMNQAFIPYKETPSLPTFIAPIKPRCAYCRTLQEGAAHCESCGAPQ